MSWRQTRERRRRARIEQAEAEFSRARGSPAALAGLLDRLASSDTPIWPIAEAAARSSPLDADERAMVAQAVAPHLAGMTPGSVKHRGDRISVSSITSQARRLRPRTMP